MLDMLPVPAAIIELQEHGFAFDAVNRPFRLAGLGTVASESPLIRLLGPRLRRFIESSDIQCEISWQFGDEVDARHFRVMLAKRADRRSFPRCMVTLVDHTSELRTEYSLRREMATDSLTGLPNRAGFSDALEHAITSENARDFAVLVVNLDRFSRVNACMGGLAGDELLITVARRMKGALRSRDTLARMGGDEFGVLLTLDEGPGDALHVAKRIQAALANPFRLSDFEIRVDCSIGIALGADNDGDPEDLVRNAQFAVKRAKKSGRTEIYQTHTFDIAREQFGIETELRRAIENGQMTLCYQPICDLATGKITSFEALARWTTEDGVRLSPNDFIPVAEESGLIIPLGRWAMEEAAQTIAAWDRASDGNCDIKVAVNLSAIQLQRDHIPAMVRGALERHGVDGKRLTLELTESAIVTDPDRIAQTMNALKDMGATLAMDDFGTGYSNLAYLQKLPIDLLKIDRSFVSGMLADRDKIAIVRAILSLAQALGMQTTAEGIETNELAQTLAALGCTYGQGFLYSRALERDEAYALLAERNA
ncbi:MAG: bifunctional diguanylate cyclase/phosphodiesterase [Sphingomonas sp.]|uniref:putative bifunctional diguanylate cyclase/phosphodiesterase n=1 Tax=unclassified Sphingomonas TaxID=196159 RepID=UPI0024542247|nr:MULTISPECIES: bifunctional diguanylate cyclase/phosphodiesterase [unclassified Sphingomonas]MBQ1499068.1 bifunctional diguanylate cyclase/phosphodiesterase [Sphingomonas sp.]MDH4746149.1 bifunctional diguanylate cyclase/phosphodiesterase [Sphingomonas sp. CBMAI 2297]